MKFVSEERQNRIKRFRSEKDKMISLLSGLLIRSKLAEFLETDPNKIEIVKGENGKPYVSNFENIHFSLSHSGEMIMLALDENNIGADTELIKKDNTDIAESFFTNTEYEYISNSENPTKNFYKIWTMKEAYLKMTGEGLTKGLDNFDVFDPKINKMLKTYSYSDKYMTAICSEKWNKEEFKPLFVNISDILGRFLP